AALFRLALIYDSELNVLHARAESKPEERQLQHWGNDEREREPAIASNLVQLLAEESPDTRTKKSFEESSDHFISAQPSSAEGAEYKSQGQARSEAERVAPGCDKREVIRPERPKYYYALSGLK